MKRPTETALVKACLELLRLRGVFAFRVNTAGVRRTDKSGRQFWSFRGTRGVSDILGCVRLNLCGGHDDPEDVFGRFIAVECKMPRGEVSADQQAFLDAVRWAGGIALVIRDVRELAEALDKEGV